MRLDSAISQVNKVAKAQLQEQARKGKHKKCSNGRYWQRNVIWMKIS